MAGGGREVTVPWRQRLTINYASPEQVHGRPVSTASDVYALGVLLFRLLSGRLPHAFDGLTPWAVGSQLRDTEPPRPSTDLVESELAAVGLQDGPRRIAELLRDDLDPIVLKALRSDPDARYRSAGHLADDLNRYLNGFPVLARRGTVRYRAMKLLRRHRLAATLGAIALTLGGLFLGSLAISAQRIARGQARLLQERAKLEEVARFFLGVFEEAGPYVAEGRADDRTRRGRPPCRSCGWGAIGPTRCTGGPCCRPSAGFIWTSVSPRGPTSTINNALALRQDHDASSLEISESLDGVAAALRDQWQLDQAVESSAAALDLARNAQPLVPYPLLRSLNNHVQLLCVSNDWSAAAPLSAEALALGRVQGDRYEVEVSKAMIQRAAVLRNLGNADDARQLYLQTEARYKDRYGANHPALATLYNNLGRLEAEDKRVEIAVDYLKRADDQYAQSFGDDYYGRILPLTNVGRLLSEAGDLSAAEVALRQALDVAVRSPDIGPEYEVVYYGRPAVALARLLASAGRCAEAVELLEDKLVAWQAHAEHAVVRAGTVVLSECQV